jgi:hypothetical protein
MHAVSSTPWWVAHHLEKELHGAWIEAAMPDGARFNPNQTKEERRALSKGKISMVSALRGYPTDNMWPVTMMAQSPSITPLV